MGDLKVGNLSVQMKLVADVQRKGEGAKVIHNPPSQPTAPRVDIKMEVETYDRKAGTSTAASTSGLPKTTGAPVKVGAGGGVLGHLLATKNEAVPDTTKLSNAELKKHLEPFLGQPVVVSNYDKDEHASLADAAKKGGVADQRGILKGMSDEGLLLEINGKPSTMQTEFWALARIKIDAPDGKVLAQDPAYAKTYSS
jgi:hypothetical protein